MASKLAVIEASWGAEELAAAGRAAARQALRTHPPTRSAVETRDHDLVLAPAGVWAAPITDADFDGCTG